MYIGALSNDFKILSVKFKNYPMIIYKLALKFVFYSRVTTGFISGSEVRLDFCVMPGKKISKRNDEKVSFMFLRSKP